MSDPPGEDTVGDTIDLGEIEPRGTRQQWRRSAVSLVEEWALVAVGTANGVVRGFDTETAGERFQTPVGDRVVAIDRTADELVVGTRGSDGWIRGLDPETGTIEWSVRSASEIGEPVEETLFCEPFVVSLAGDDDADRSYAAARRYERSHTEAGPDRRFESVVYAIEDGEPVWRYRTDASAIAIDHHDSALAVGYNRCPGDHDAGLVVLDAETGLEQYSWDPPGDEQRRVGAVACTADGVAVASHTDYRGYLVDETGSQWRVDLGRPVERSGERVYSYPTQVRQFEDGFAFVTGNTFPEAGRETEQRHPDEHSVHLVGGDGSCRRRDRIGGWVSELAGEETGLFVACGQHFRDRDPSVHGTMRLTPTGSRRVLDTAGPTTAIDGAGDRYVSLEEPVAFHDGEETNGRYRLHVRELCGRSGQ